MDKPPHSIARSSVEREPGLSITFILCTRRTGGLSIAFVREDSSLWRSLYNDFFYCRYIFHRFHFTVFSLRAHKLLSKRDFHFCRPRSEPHLLL